MMPKTTKNRPQEVSKCLLERMCGFEARSHSIFHDFGLQHGLNMGSKIVQKTLKNRLGRPKAAEKPQGTHFDPKLTPFWTILATNFASKSAQKMLQNYYARATLANLALQNARLASLFTLAACSVAGFGGAAPLEIRPPSFQTAKHVEAGCCR